MERFDLLVKNFDSLSNELRLIVQQLKQENNDVFNAIVEHSPNFIAILQKGKYVFVNSGGLKMLRCKNSSEIIGKDFAETIAPESLKIVQERIESAVKEPNLPIQVKIKRWDGSVFISESNSVPFVFNKQPAVLVIGRDITTELEQRSIAQNEEKLRTDILNSFEEVIAFYNPEHQIIWLNDAGKKQLKITDESYIGQKCHMVWFGTKNPCPTCPMVHHKDEIKERIVTFADKTIWKIRHTPLYNDKSIITGYIEFRENVTEKETFKIEFEKSHNRLVNAEIANKFGHIEYDLLSKKLVLSHGVYNLVGLPNGSKKLKLNNLTDYVEADDLPGLKELISKTLNDKGKFQYVFNIHDQLANKKIIRGIVHLNNNKLFAVIQDVTGFIQLEKQLRDEREKYKMLAENTPFGLILTQKGSPVYMNKTLLDWIGIESVNDFKLDEVLNNFLPIERKMIGEILSTIDENSLPDPFIKEFSIFNKEGQEKNLRFNIKKYSINGQDYVQTVITDITADIAREKKQKQIASDALYIAQKNSILSEIEAELNKIIRQKTKYNQADFKSIYDIISSYKQLDKDWGILVSHFNDVHPDFFNTLHNLHPNLSNNDVKHCACIKMNFDTKQIARFFNIKAVSVQIWRVRLKKKLNLTENDDLRNYILSI